MGRAHFHHWRGKTNDSTNLNVYINSSLITQLILCPPPVALRRFSAVIKIRRSLLHKESGQSQTKERAWFSLLLSFSY